MLGVPPAFVLSQDQTLYKVVYISSLELKYLILFNNACVITAFFLVFRLTFPSLKEISRVVTFFLALFNFQVAGLCPLRTALILYHNSKSLSSTFSSFFKKLFVAAVLSRDSFNIISLSNSFVKYFFQKTVKNFSQSPVSCFSPRSTVILLYHLSLLLSTKSITGDFFLFCVICTYASHIKIYIPH